MYSVIKENEEKIVLNFM